MLMNGSMELETPSLIKVDLTENDTTYTVRAEIPGVEKKDVKAQVDGNRVSISAERLCKDQQFC